MTRLQDPRRHATEEKRRIAEEGVILRCQVGSGLHGIADMYLEPEQKRTVALKAAGQFHAPDERLAPWGPSDAHP